VECQRWFGTIASQTSAMSVPLDFIIEVWYFAEEHGEFFCYSVLTFPGNIFHFEQNLINSLRFFFWLWICLQVLLLFKTFAKNF
jgi:hypothetical protein